MSREIKFRIWNEFAEEMLYPTDSVGIVKLPDWDMGEPAPVMQFTGLHDKNGKEIYENDIVKKTMHYCNDDGEPEGEAEEDVAVVEWCEDKGRQFVGFDLLPCDDIYKLEVIGNLHENKELLK